MKANTVQINKLWVALSTVSLKYKIEKQASIQSEESLIKILSTSLILDNLLIISLLGVFIENNFVMGRALL
ncbi:hypothetical protein GCM10027566_40490 [Arachidicoccus ginsenosidivorans]|uniref:Uncharacterized protein n=1 Tax=Arachidicoccus ginsenosidivorans TaxID=496057 RepID=A0A5B8VP00_9BACT|nr:hypothetical protein [Arachidicoccus ginsenosidivorans]QEC72953.1 hypothetical protein FSB73_15975 [Arachidicoccus ginsenosidivorans]